MINTYDIRGYCINHFHILYPTTRILQAKSFFSVTKTARAKISLNFQILEKNWIFAFFFKFLDLFGCSDLCGFFSLLVICVGRMAGGREGQSQAGPKDRNLEVGPPNF